MSQAHEHDLISIEEFIQQAREARKALGRSSYAGIEDSRRFCSRRRHGAMASHPARNDHIGIVIDAQNFTIRTGTPGRYPWGAAFRGSSQV